MVQPYHTVCALYPPRQRLGGQADDPGMQPGGYNAANTLFRRPDLFSCVIALPAPMTR